MQSNRPDERNMKWSNRKGFLQFSAQTPTQWCERRQSRQSLGVLTLLTAFPSRLCWSYSFIKDARTRQFHFIYKQVTSKDLRFPLIICVLLLIFCSKGTSLAGEKMYFYCFAEPTIRPASSCCSCYKLLQD